jgi:hypothetical protein
MISFKNIMPNFQPWDELLHQYVDEQGLVNYQGMTAESTQKLTTWLEELSQINPELLDPNQQLALWLNLYNALVIKQVLKNYPLKSILPKFLGVPNWLAFWMFFSRPVYSINQHRYSLNNIEHDIIRQKFHNPRIHFALVCAAIGCPLLRNQAYRCDRLETQLDEDARRFINNPNKVYYDQNKQVLYCSQIFNWYKKDFLKVSNSIPEYIQTYLSLDISLNEQVTIKYLDYTWSLNQRISS